MYLQQKGFQHSILVMCFTNTLVVIRIQLDFVELYSIVLVMIHIKEIEEKWLESIPIEQKCFSVNEKYEAKKLLSLIYLEELTEEYDNHCIVFIKDNIPIPIINISSDSSIRQSIEDKNFKKTLLELPEITYESLLLFTSLFFKVENHKLINLFQYKNNLPPVELEYLFKDSFGYLIYSHQLEQLYMMITNCGLEEAVDFRRSWNKKNALTRIASQQILINNNYSLYDFIYEFTIDENRFVYHANFGAAHRLWSYITNKQ